MKGEGGVVRIGRTTFCGSNLKGEVLTGKVRMISTIKMAVETALTIKKVQLSLEMDFLRWMACRLIVSRFARTVTRTMTSAAR